MLIISLLSFGCSLELGLLVLYGARCRFFGNLAVPLLGCSFELGLSTGCSFELGLYVVPKAVQKDLAGSGAVIIMIVLFVFVLVVLCNNCNIMVVVLSQSWS